MPEIARPRDVPGLLSALQAMLADLTSYIERRAEELAAPLAAAAQAEANEAIREARAETQRSQDLTAALRRAGADRDRIASRARDRLTAALGAEPGQTLGTLVAEAERVMAEQAAEIERLRYQIRDGTKNAAMDEVPLPEPGSGTDG